MNQDLLTIRGHFDSRIDRARLPVARRLLCGAKAADRAAVAYQWARLGT